MVADSIPELKNLSLAKKRRLIAELLDEVYGEAVTEPVVVKALEARMAHARRNPASVRSWEDVKVRIRRKR
jgi:hypothetical protein